MKTSWILIACLALTLAEPALAVGNTPATAADYAPVCDLVFLDQSLEPDSRLVQDTLDKILTVDYPLFFSGGMSRLLIKNLYNHLRGRHPSLDPKTRFTDDLRLNVDVFGFYNYNSVPLKSDFFLGPVWNILQQLPAAPEIVEAVATYTWNEIESDIRTRDALWVMNNLQTITPELYPSFAKVIQQIQSNPKLTALAIKAIGNLLLTANDWGPKLAVFYIYAETDRHYSENSNLRNKFVTAHMRSLTPIEAPTHARLGATPPPKVYDLTAIKEAIRSQQYSNANNALQSFYLVSQEQLQQGQEWTTLYQSFKRRLNDSTQTIAAIRALIGARALVDQQLLQIIEVNKLLGSIQASLQEHLATIQDENELAVQSALLQRILRFHASVQSTLVELSQAQAIFEVLLLDEKSKDATRTQLKELQQLLKLNPELLKLIKKEFWG